MATIKERRNADGTLSYQVTIRLKKAKNPIYKTFSKKTEAKDWVQEQETKIKKNKYAEIIEAGKRTLSELIDRYIADSFPDRKSQATPLYTLNFWKDKIGYVRLEDVNTTLIKDHWDTINKMVSQKTAEPISNRTKNSYLETLSAMFSRAIREYGWMAEHPIEKKIKKKPINNQIERYLSEDELRRYMLAVSSSNNNYLKTAVLISLSNGGRKSEVLGLTWKDVNFVERTVTYRDTKNSTDRTVPISDTAFKALQELGKVRNITSPYIFARRRSRWRNGDVKNESKWEDLKKPFLRAVKVANIQGFRWHDMRHQAASMLLAAGASLAEVGKILGHKDPKMTYRYVHLMQQKSFELIDRVDEQIKKVA